MFEKFYLGASRLSMRRMAARSMKASEVWTFNSRSFGEPAVHWRTLKNSPHRVANIRTKSLCHGFKVGREPGGCFGLKIGKTLCAELAALSTGWQGAVSEGAVAIRFQKGRDPASTRGHQSRSRKLRDHYLACPSGDR